MDTILRNGPKMDAGVLPFSSERFALAWENYRAAISWRDLSQQFTVLLSLSVLPEQVATGLLELASDPEKQKALKR